MVISSHCSGRGTGQHLPGVLSVDLKRNVQLDEAGPRASLTAWDGPLNYERDDFPLFPTAKGLEDLIQRFSAVGNPAVGLLLSRGDTSIELPGDIRCVNEEIPNDPDNAS